MSAWKRITDSYLVRACTLILFGLVTAIWLTASPSARAIASEVSDLEQEYPYIYWMPEFQTLALSKKPISQTTISSSNGIVITSFSNGAEVETHTFKYTFLYIPNYVVGDAYRLIYNPVTGWEAEYPDFVDRGLTQSGTYYSVFGRETTFEYYSNVSGDLPVDIPPLDDIQDQINDALNTTTNITDQANDVTNQMQSATERFKNGDITVNQFQNIIQNNITITNELMNNSGATLADQIAVNNAQNAIQIGQDALIGSQIDNSINEGLQDVENQIDAQIRNDNRISDQLIEELNRLFAPSDASSMISDPSEVINMLKELYLTPYVNGDKSKDEVLYESSMIDGVEFPSIIELKGILTDYIKYCETLGDYEVINTCIDNVNTIINSINQAGDVNPDIAESADNQESDEIDLLNNMIQEMEGNEPEKIMNNQQIQQDLQGVSRWIEPMWNNKFISAVVTIFCILVPICVILDLRYRYL